MPWRKMRLRDSEVWARVDDEGNPIADAGRVEIRYNAKSPKAYHAAAKNLEVVEGSKVMPDDHCAAIEASAPAKKPGARTTKAEALAKGGVDGPKIAEGAIIVYADGACSGNPGPAGLGMVLIDGKSRLELSEYLGTATNNIAELTAVLRALEASPDDARPLAIHTDSQYSIGVLSKGWKAKANTELVLSIRAKLAGRHNVTLHYVPGHAGVLLNERADELARQAVTNRATSEKRYGS
ncbi:MAG: ribonuclease HI [Myxococcales bacterium]|nr:ribonuclease HI [Myxococcales bacterium]